MTTVQTGAAALQLILEFERAALGAVAARRVPLPFGEAVLTPERPLIHDINTVIVDRWPPGTDPQAVIAEAEAVSAGAGLEHCRIRVEGTAAAAALDGPLRARGWIVDRHLAMVHRRPADRVADTSMVTEVDVRGYLPAHTMLTAEEPWAGPLVIEQMNERWLDLAAHLDLRGFIVADGGPVAGCVLYGDGTVAQIDSVAVLSTHRGRGFGRAVTQRAVAAALDANIELLHLFADAEDWPRDLYGRLGFDVVGSIDLYRRPDPTQEAHP
jgi:ribosomal protein S18 acetylase RimI-like enzyme